MPKVQKEKKPTELYTGYGRVADGENEMIKVRATDFKDARKKLTAGIRDLADQSRAEVYIEFIIRNNLQLMDESVDRNLANCYEIEAPWRPEILGAFEEEFKNQLNIIHRSGALTGDEHPGVLAKIALARAASSFRLLSKDHQQLLKKLEAY